MKVIIAGTRTFDDYRRLERVCDNLLKNFNKNELIIVSGTAEGADTLGKAYGDANGIAVVEFPARWDDLNAPGAIIRVNKFGKKYNAKAGVDRNEEMAEYANGAIIFWDGKSKGTKSMIELAEKYKLKLKVVIYE